MRKNLLRKGVRELTEGLKRRTDRMDADDYEPSEEYVSQVMNSISQHYDAYQKRTRRKRICVSLVSFLLVASLSACLICFAPPVMADLLSWFQVEDENGIWFHYQTDNTSELPTLRPTWLPEGAELVDTFLLEGDCILEYTDGTSGLIFAYNRFDSNSLQGIVSPNLSRKEEFQLNGCYATYVPDTDSPGGDLFWIDEQQEISFSINSNYSKEIMLKVAESIAPVSDQG